ncbi:MAG TPA: hypothetical protein VH496_09090 [Mycobacterium sp.]
MVKAQARSLLQRGLDTASEYADVAAHKFRRAADPRARLLRKRRWALRLGLFFTVSCFFWIVVTLLLGSWGLPAWALLIPGAIAVAAAAPATLLLLRYLWLRREPLPPARPGVVRRLPPAGSVAREPMATLAAAERGMFSLIGVMERAELLPHSEIAEVTRAADAAAATMSATAIDVVSMEKAMRSAPSSRASLLPTVHAFAAQLGHGVRQYNEMVNAAAQLVSTSSSPMPRQRYRDELVGATDRLLGWAQAFDELNAPRRLIG